MAHRLPLADIQFIADFAAYARGRGPGEGYDYCSNYNCAGAQFLRDTGRAKCPDVGPFGWRDDALGQECDTPFPPGVEDALNPSNSRTVHTFSALANRLEALIADAPMVLS